MTETIGKLKVWQWVVVFIWVAITPTTGGLAGLAGQFVVAYALVLIGAKTIRAYKSGVNE